MLLGRVRAWQRGWHGRSKIEKVEFQSLASWHALPWIFYLSWSSLPLGLSLRPGVTAHVLGWTLIVLGAVQCVHANRTMRRSLDHFLKRRAMPRRDLGVAIALMTVAYGVAIGLQATDSVKEGLLSLTAMYLMIPFGQALAFAVPIRTYLIRIAVLDVLIVAGFTAAGVRDGRLLALAGFIVFGGVLTLFASRCGAWTLSVMWEADRAREVEARLAVAEERLRFGRDLHDVMGRNLAVIALKSELAVQLARRGRDEAVDQMVEVQRIAQESQREVREVVRGYREIDLGVELTGAQGVLEAAGIRCRVTGSATGLPAAVQSALGWVVREAATNVLRHGDARRCDITLAAADGHTRLVVENDGVTEAPARDGTAEGDPPRHRGTGLAGLRERLAAVGGTLEWTSADGSFRLRAEVPPQRSDRAALREPADPAEEEALL
ncbi:sensor histidine kinase [Streptomyces sp. NPDC005863]|uniref:sensor histidine kinase n=1 Tax=unclassified Streptomyces TaxID=2593676 RepID=UPI0033EF9CBE